MDCKLYLSLIPEALVVSMLSPDEFGGYLAVGTKKRAREQAMYFDLTGGFESKYFDLEGSMQLCKPHEDGRPKHSVYVSTYRVLEHVPLNVLGSLWLTTRNGLTLELKQGVLPPGQEGTFHLYQELCPVHPLITSSLGPVEFCKFITDPKVRISVPMICFVELQLGTLLETENGECDCGLPYRNISHLKDCVLELVEKAKITKTVDRIHPPHVSFRCIKGGVYMGAGDELLYYPLPSVTELEASHHRWWRSAQES